MLEPLADAITELAIAIAKLKYVHSVLQKAHRDERQRQRNQLPEPQKES